MYHNNKQVGRTRVNKIKEGKLSRKTHVQNKKPKNKPFNKLFLLQNELFKEGLNAAEYNNYITEKMNQKKYYYRGLTDDDIGVLTERYGDLIQKENNTYTEIGDRKDINRKRRKVFKEKKRNLITEKKRELINQLFKEMKQCRSLGVLRNNESLSSDPSRWNTTKLLLFSGGRYIETSDKGWGVIYQKINSPCSHYLFNLSSNDDLNDYVLQC
tara:strand:+ start:260 stop:898 length:639 start_codon:yes stop_codon:yes gene_type:complete